MDKVPIECRVWAEEITQTAFGKKRHHCHNTFSGVGGNVRKRDELDLTKVPTMLPKSKWEIYDCKPHNHKGEACEECKFNPKKRIIKALSELYNSVK